MKFKLEINMDNAAFEDDSEIKRIMDDMAKKISHGYPLRCWDKGVIYDINGNKVGTWEVTE